MTMLTSLFPFPSGTWPTPPQGPTRCLSEPVTRLNGPEDLEEWQRQLEWAAGRLGIYPVLFCESHSREAKQHQRPGSLNRLVSDLQRTTAIRLLHSTVSGKLWAYMRVLGHSDETANPSLSRVLATVVATSALTTKNKLEDAYEVQRLLFEWSHATKEQYISVERYEEAREWFREQLKRHYERGHAEVHLAMDAGSFPWVTVCSDVFAEAEKAEPEGSRASR